MVAEGTALADRRYSTEYVDEEDAGRAAGQMPPSQLIIAPPATTMPYQQASDVVPVMKIIDHRGDHCRPLGGRMAVG